LTKEVQMRLCVVRRAEIRLRQGQLGGRRDIKDRHASTRDRLA
jgi:hypothetical protein